MIVRLPWRCLSRTRLSLTRSPAAARPSLYQVAAEKLLKLLNEELDVQDAPDAVPLRVSDGVISFGASLGLMPSPAPSRPPD